MPSLSDYRVTPPMTLDELKLMIQRHLSDGLITVVGSGLSCAEGLPGMGQLAADLEAKIGPGLSASDTTLWSRIVALIKSKGLESALLEIPATQQLEDEIRAVVVNSIRTAESRVVAEVFEGKRTLKLSKLITHLLKPSSGLQIVTPNYDRLVEVAAEEAGLGVDTMFAGVFAGALNESECRSGFCRRVEFNKGKPRLIFTNRAVVSKPHGSLDWYQRAGKPVRHCSDLDSSTRLVIPPGQNKFRDGYGSPFDAHRERANREIDKASRFLIIGYGFNDDHLETHLRQRIVSGIPTMIFTQALSANALKLMHDAIHVIGIEADTSVPLGTKVHTNGSTDNFIGKNLWDIGSMIDEVFQI